MKNTWKPQVKEHNDNINKGQHGRKTNKRKDSRTYKTGKGK